MGVRPHTSSMLEEVQKVVRDSRKLKEETKKQQKEEIKQPPIQNSRSALKSVNSSVSDSRSLSNIVDIKINIIKNSTK